MNIEKAAITFMALLEGTLAQELHMPDAKDAAEQLQYGVNLLLKGLQGEAMDGEP